PRGRGPGGLRRLGLAPVLGGLGATLPEGTPGKRYLRDAGLPRMERYLAGMTHFSDAALGGLLRGEAASALARAVRLSRASAPGGRALPFPARLQHHDVETYLPGD